MRVQVAQRVWRRRLTAFFMLCLLVVPATAASVQSKREKAREQYDNAERMREELNGLPQNERTRREYQRVMDAYRSVYYTAPDSSKADASIVAVAELLAESGRALNDDKLLRNAIAQYEFLRRDYPGSKYRFDALFTIGQIYKEDLEENDKARETFQEVMHRYPHLQIAADAREAIAEMDQQAHARPKPADAKPADVKPVDAKAQESKAQESPNDTPHSGLPLVTGIRHWSTPDYTRVAIDLEQEVKYEAGRVPNPDRIFFDLHDTRLASTLAGKSFDVSDGFLRRVRVAQFQKDMVRVVLEVDAVSDYSVFLLPNPYRLIIDIHGRKPGSPRQTPQSQTLLARAQKPAEKQGEQTASEKQSGKKGAEATAQAPSTASANPEAGHPVHPAAGRAGVEFGPRRADGSFYSHPQRESNSAAVQDAAMKRAAEESAKNAAELEAKNEAEQEAKRAAGQETKNGRTISAAPSAADSAKAAGSDDVETPSSAESQESTKAEVAKLEGPEMKATDKPTSEPTVQVVAPRDAEHNADRKTERDTERQAEQAEPGRLAARKGQRESEFRQAQPTEDGQRSLIRALGLKVGRIVIDAGHGGHDTGTIGPGGLLEKDLVLDVALRLGRLLQNKLGAEVIYTRDDDTFVPLETRTAIANEKQADLFISIHANSSPDPAARGVETYYLNFNPSPEAMEVAARENALSEKSVHELGDLVKKITLRDKVEESREFAIDVQRSLYQGEASKDSGIHDRGVKKALFIVLLGANMPSILTEISFISNPKDEHKLETPEYRQKIAESLYKGIARYINGLSGMKVASKSAPAEPQETALRK